MITFYPSEVLRLESSPSAISLLITFYKNDQSEYQENSEQWKGFQYRIDELVSWKAFLKSRSTIRISALMMYVPELEVFVSEEYDGHDYLHVTKDGVKRRMLVNKKLRERLFPLSMTVGSRLVFKRVTDPKTQKLDYTVHNERQPYKFAPRPLGESNEPVSPTD